LGLSDGKCRKKSAQTVSKNWLFFTGGPNGKAIIAEFIYGGKVTPTLPILNPGKERWLGWWIKASFLPIMYWQYMLKGYEWFPKHNTAFKEPTAG
jgi:hypothetical protein